MRIVKRVALAFAAVALAAAGAVATGMYHHGHHPPAVAMYHHGKPTG